MSTSFVFGTICLTPSRESTTLLSTHVQDLHTDQQRNVSESAILALNIQKQQVVQETMLAKVIDILSGAMEPRIELLIDLTRQVWDSNIRSTQILEKMALQGPPPDSRHTWLQDPIRLEDLFGRYITIPSDFSFEMMEAVILAKCKAGPSARKIRSRQYEISNSRNSNQLITKERFTGFIPGMYLRMAILIYGENIQTDRCPILTCGSRMLSDDCGGGKTW